ncbi:MAG: hypothetical protein HC803_10845 [Saprospiraceae bacterium]|nr:hypothetical protein [Saprospiraceae bacterium]
MRNYRDYQNIINTAWQDGRAKGVRGAAVIYKIIERGIKCNISMMTSLF